jgi:hypothetical protein
VCVRVSVLPNKQITIKRYTRIKTLPLAWCMLVIYGLFNDAVSSSHYIASNDRMINE